MSDKITYKFCVESLRYAYEIIGYDNILKEINFIHYLNTSNKTELTLKLEKIDKVDEINQVIIPDIVNIPSENKNIVIQPSNTKYVRTTISDEERCDTILSTGKRCTLRKSDNSNNCGRHTK